jgi:hypothetical protein
MSEGKIAVHPIPASEAGSDAANRSLIATATIVSIVLAKA